MSTLAPSCPKCGHNEFIVFHSELETWCPKCRGSGCEDCYNKGKITLHDLVDLRTGKFWGLNNQDQHAQMVDKESRNSSSGCLVLLTAALTCCSMAVAIYLLS